MTPRERYQERAEQLLLRGPVLAAWLLLNLHADEEGECPACHSRVDRFEASRCTHARLCTRLHALATADQAPPWARPQAAGQRCVDCGAGLERFVVYGEDDQPRCGRCGL